MDLKPTNVIAGVSILFAIATYISYLMHFSGEYDVHSLADSETNVPAIPNHADGSVFRAVPDEISVCQPEDRITHLRTMCQKLNLDTFNKLYDHRWLYVNEKYKYVACLPPKAGCSAWKIMLINNTLDIPVPSTFKFDHLHTTFLRYGFERLTHYNSTLKKSEILRDYYKFMVVRHPFDRLLSGYTDKIVNERFKYLKNRIIDKFGDASLSSFMKAAIGSWLRDALDCHFVPATYLCDPCNVRYDKIIKLETHYVDFEDVISHLGPHSRMQDVRANSAMQGEEKMNEQMFTRNLPQYGNVSDGLLNAVLDVIGFKYDLSLFGYSWKRETPKSGLVAQCSDDKLKCC